MTADRVARYRYRGDRHLVQLEQLDPVRGDRCPSHIRAAAGADARQLLTAASGATPLTTRSAACRPDGYRGLVLALVLVALSLGLSNFAAAIGMGVAGVDARTRVRVGIVFGIFEAGMPILGLALGHSLASTLGHATHWVGGGGRPRTSPRPAELATALTHDPEGAPRERPGVILVNRVPPALNGPRLMRVEGRRAATKIPLQAGRADWRRRGDERVRRSPIRTSS